MLSQRLKLQPIHILTILHTDRLPTGFHLHPHLQFVSRIDFDLSHSLDIVFKFSDPDDEEKLVKAPRQVEDHCVGEEFGIALGFNFLKLSAFALQTARSWNG